jgi:hypothetical protein
LDVEGGGPFIPVLKVDKGIVIEPGWFAGAEVLNEKLR